jgi:hypothetical protein
MRLTLAVRRQSRAHARQMLRCAVAGAALAFAATKANAASSVRIAPEVDRWGTMIAQAPLPGEGCFTADYPAMQWKSVKCGRPHMPSPPLKAAGSPSVGHGHDYAAVVSPALISRATGSFPATSGLVSESDSSTGVANVYSLQINSQYISGASICAGAHVANCQAWQQFVFDDQGNASQSSVFLQYWLLNYGTPCPTGWQAYPGSNSCTRNGHTNYLLFYVDVQNLTKIKLAAVASDGGYDRAILITPSQAYAVASKDSIIHLAKYWNTAEFNVFGGGGGSDANFNTGTSITVRLALNDGTTNAPTCQPDAGTTGEGNNLNLHPCTAGVSGSTPFIRFRESN